MTEQDDSTRVVEQPSGAHGDLPQRATSPTVERPKRIVHGIEFFWIGDEEDCQCARCGSSCFFRDCDNCGGEGEIEDDDWQCEGEYYKCDWCRGTGGWWRCCSSAAWCRDHPNPGREDQPVMGCEAHDYD